MKVRAPLLLVSVAALVAALGCGSSATTSTNITGPSNTRCQATVSNSSNSFGPSGGTGTVTVSLPRECAWTAAAEASWIAITSAREGQGDGTVTYRVEANAEPVTRQGVLVVSERQVSVGQGAAPCRYEVVPAEQSVASSGGSVNVEVRTHAACGWTAASDVPWATVSPASARGAGVARVQVSANTGAAARALSVTVAGERITATQSGVAAPAPPAPNPPSPTPPAPPTPGPTPPPSPPNEPTPVGTVRFDGRVESVSGSCPIIIFTVRDRVVYTTARTDIRSGPCKDIREGRRVEVEGTLMSDGRVNASRVTLRKDDGIE